MNCDYCGKSDFTHISQLNKHKPLCLKNPANNVPDTSPQPSEGHYITFTDAQVQALQEHLGDDYAVALNRRVDALIKEMTSGKKVDAVIPREFMLKHLPSVVPVVGHNGLGWYVFGALDADLNLHLDWIKDQRRGR